MLTFEVYADHKNQWRWRLLASNHRVIGDSGEGYRQQSDCEAAVEMIQQEAGTSQVRVKAVK